MATGCAATTVVSNFAGSSVGCLLFTPGTSLCAFRAVGHLSDEHWTPACGQHGVLWQKSFCSSGSTELKANWAQLYFLTLKPALRGLPSSLWGVFKKQALQSHWRWHAQRAALAEEPHGMGQPWSNAMRTKRPLQESQGARQAQILNSSQVSIHPVLPLFTKWCINFYWSRWSYIALSKHC